MEDGQSPDEIRRAATILQAVIECHRLIVLPHKTEMIYHFHKCRIGFVVLTKVLTNCGCVICECRGRDSNPHRL